MTLYEKRGRRYLPVYDSDAYRGLFNGSWLVVVRDGCKSIQAITPARAAWVAAAEGARDAMVAAIMRASERRPRDEPLRAKEQRAYEAWRAIMGEDTMYLKRDSAQDIARAGIDAVKMPETEGS